MEEVIPVLIKIDAELYATYKKIVKASGHTIGYMNIQVFETALKEIIKEGRIA